MRHIFHSFPITNEEYVLLDDKYGELAQFQAWQLIKKNSRNNHNNGQEDFAQDLRISLLTAGSYYKRQTYIEECLRLCHKYADDKFIRRLVAGLADLWLNKTRHGANRQKFGIHQEKLLDKLVKALVPARQRPSRKAPLRLDAKFNRYCKAITWNNHKAMGKKITREKAIRAGQVSLSEFEYLGVDSN